MILYWENGQEYTLEPLTKSEERIIKLIRDNPNLSRREIAEIAGLSIDTVQGHIGKIYQKWCAYFINPLPSRVYHKAKIQQALKIYESCYFND